MENKNFIQRMKMDIDTLSDYYMEKRLERFESNIPLKGIDLRKEIHGIPLKLVELDRKASKETVSIINDERIITDRPKIYACTHIGGNDIQRVFEAIREHAYLFLGDPKGLYKDISGLLLFLNGVINMETKDKTDRFIAKERAIELLNKNGNLLIFPEGAWNITPNLLVMDLYKGAVLMARETGADIIPVAIEQYDNDFFVSIGKNIKMDDYSTLSLGDLNIVLRDAMGTQKWNIVEKHPQSRKDLNIDEKDFAQSIVDKCPYGFTVEDVEKTRYIDKDKIVLQKPYGFVKQKRLTT